MTTKCLAVVLACIILSGCFNRGPPIANAERLIPIEKMSVFFPNAGFPDRSELTLDFKSIFVTDPTYLADVFDANDDPIAKYLREHAVIVYGFSGDYSTPIWWKEPYLVLPTSLPHTTRDTVGGQIDKQPPTGVTELAKHVSCESASFVFLRITEDLPPELCEKIGKTVEHKNGVILDLPSGTYRFYFEQFEPPEHEKNNPHIYRNIVAKRIR